MGTSHRLLVNGKAREANLDFEDTPLLYVLRDDLGLKGTRFGCGSGQCGACTVLIDGKAQRSCEVPAWSVEGKTVTTVEGLGSADQPHPLQQAIIEFQAGQCGYCLSGIVMKAAELVASSTPPSREKLVAHLADNLCRCGSHVRILDAIEHAWRKQAAR